MSEIPLRYNNRNGNIFKCQLLVRNVFIYGLYAWGLYKLWLKKLNAISLFAKIITNRGIMKMPCLQQSVINIYAQ